MKVSGMKDIFQRLNQYLAFVILVVVVLYFGKAILIPVALGALFSMLMAPVCRFLDKRGLNRGLSSFLCVFVILAVMLGMLAIIGGQFAAFKKDYPKIKEKAITMVSQAQGYVEQRFGIEPEKQKQMAKEEAKKSSGNKGSFLTRIVGGLTSTIGTLVLALVCAFLMLYNKERFEAFFLALYKDHDEAKVKMVVRKIAEVSQKYLTGRVMSIGIIAAMYAVGLSLVGIKNAILLAGVAAIMTLIPYLGTVLGGLIPVFMALATEDSIEPALWAAGVLFFIQTMDNYFIEPNVVGGEVNLNALASILSVIAGGLLWGPAGMIIFLPVAGIIKIICDHVEPLRPISILIGESGGEKPSKIKLWLQQQFKKFTRKR